MKIYILKDVQDARDCRQLMSLKSDCIKLEWSKTMTNIPSDVFESLGCIEQFVDSKISDMCKNNIDQFEINEDEEMAILAAIKKEKFLKETIGTGVVLEDEIDSTLVVVSNLNLPTLSNALKLHKNCIII